MVAPSLIPNHWLFQDPSGVGIDGPTVVFDIDGVLADAAGRQHFIDGPDRRDWDRFFAMCGEDPLIEEVAVLLSLLDASLNVVLLTGRPLSVQTETLAWMKRYDLRWDILIMRNFGDHSAAKEFKSVSIQEMRLNGIIPVLAFEDDRRNVQMFRDEQVPCVYIHSGYYDRQRY